MIRPPVRPANAARFALATVLALVLAGCERNPLVVRRSSCPAVAVTAYAGDVTLFRSAVPDAANIDVVAAITNLRSDCAETADQFVSRISYDVLARRSDVAEARSVALPVFAAVVQAGNIVAAKQISTVTVNFAAGQDRAMASHTASASVSRKAAALPEEIQARISRERRPGDPDAATDPLADPVVRSALRAVSFEVLIGFQIDDRALAYNVAK
jgi:hypothetical protein